VKRCSANGSETIGLVRVGRRQVYARLQAIGVGHFFCPESKREGKQEAKQEGKREGKQEAKREGKCNPKWEVKTANEREWTLIFKEFHLSTASPC
jgi:hypothetical protein